MTIGTPTMTEAEVVEWEEKCRVGTLFGVIKMRHGTRLLYSRYGCRCPLCRGAERQYSQSRRALQPKSEPKPRQRLGIQHGRLTTYGYHGCRCVECRAAHRAYYQRGEVAP